MHWPVVVIEAAASSRAGIPSELGPPRAGAETQLEGDLCAVRPDHPVDVVGRDAGVGQGPQGAENGD